MSPTVITITPADELSAEDKALCLDHIFDKLEHDSPFISQADGAALLEQLEKRLEEQLTRLVVQLEVQLTQ